MTTGIHFELHPRLAADSLYITDLAFCRLLLMNDERFPWIILVPRKAQVSEIFELTPSEQQALLLETITLSKLFKNLYQADKLNIASIGNIVPQLHVHIIARFIGDKAWPTPVWGFQKPIPYSVQKSEETITEIKRIIASPNE